MHKIRTETPADAAAIALIVERAFTDHPHSLGTEVAIVRQLRAAAALSVSLVVEAHGQVLGYIAASPVQIAGRPSNWHGLGPVAVDPGAQGAGLGSALVTECLTRLRTLGSGGCVVLGEPAYYRRFGFEAWPDLVYTGPPPEYFMAQAFVEPMPRGEVTYHAAFASEA